MKSCCFTGHRPADLELLRDEEGEDCRLMKEALYALIRGLALERGVRHFISGMALGLDQIAAEAVLRLKAELQVTLEAALPFEGQGLSWSSEHEGRHRRILKSCDSVVAMQEGYSIGCYHRRNRYMVEKADVLLAVWSGKTSGGSYQTLNYARKKGKPIVILRVPELRVEFENMGVQTSLLQEGAQNAENPD
ncbi:MAG: DUF1273 domain-containing protein [Christensenellaceae bacterium]|jgi:uncharacterized phage-like protein YoqJ|nr:DUF1273 domain-containing protein [Christensenellaceae bacterium]